MVICYGVMLPESGRLCKLLVRKSANWPASLGCPAGGALGLPGLLPTLQGGYLTCLPPAGAHISPFSLAVRVMWCKVVFCALSEALTEQHVQGVSGGCYFPAWCSQSPVCRSYREHGCPVWRPSGGAMPHPPYSLARHT